MNRPPELDITDHDAPRVARRGRADSVIDVGTTAVGDGSFCLIAGPCAVESADQITEAARLVADAGAALLRGGAFKPRTSPYTFQGLGIEGVEMMRKAADDAGLPLVTEIPAPDHLEAMAPLVDAFQVGARNMQNFSLLEALGDADCPVLLKRSFGATPTEWLLAAEHLAEAGNERIILCERGIRSFGDELRFTLDLAGALWVRRRTHLPVVVDPSHATGDPDLVADLVAAGRAAGLDGAMVEVHPRPTRARCDGDQALAPDDFRALISGLDGPDRPLTSPDGTT